MEFDRFHHFASLLIEDDFVLTYSGYVTEDILQAIGDTLRQQLLVKSHDRNQVRNLFSVFVELMQNVIRYGHEGPQPSLSMPAQKPVGLVLVAQNGQQINLLTGNYVTNDEAIADCRASLICGVGSVSVHACADGDPSGCIIKPAVTSNTLKKYLTMPTPYCLSSAPW